MRGAIGVTGQYSAVDKLLTGEENLQLMADLHHLSRKDGKRKTADLLEQFDLVEAARKPASTLTAGIPDTDTGQTGTGQRCGPHGDHQGRRGLHPPQARTDDREEAPPSQPHGRRKYRGPACFAMHAAEARTG
ncbi:hypothetical protein [Actinocorallia aurea]